MIRAIIVSLSPYSFSFIPSRSAMCSNSKAQPFSKFKGSTQNDLPSCKKTRLLEVSFQRVAKCHSFASSDNTATTMD